MFLSRVLQLVYHYAIHVVQYLMYCVAFLLASTLRALVSYHGLLVVQIAGFCTWWILLLQNVSSQALV